MKKHNIEAPPIKHFKVYRKKAPAKTAKKAPAKKATTKAVKKAPVQKRKAEEEFEEIEVAAAPITAAKSSRKPAPKKPKLSHEPAVDMPVMPGRKLGRKPGHKSFEVAAPAMAAPKPAAKPRKSTAMKPKLSREPVAKPVKPVFKPVEPSLKPTATKPVNPFKPGRKSTSLVEEPSAQERFY